ncbi:hypothetical protein [Streptomyces sp. MAR4 CNX-425]|uniref:hypothetical protein n=1 Tax=Streptomyces sp. MAR4 CNX-425 TaxID=3406343 RepID=UPI003B503935
MTHVGDDRGSAVPDRPSQATATAARWPVAHLVAGPFPGPAAADPEAMMALTHTGTQSRALFSGPDGSVRSVWAGEGGRWRGPAVLAPAGSCAPGTPVGLARRTSAGCTEAAYAGADGSILVMWSRREGDWQGPHTVAPPGTCAPGAAVTLAHQRTMDQLDLLCTGADGSVQVLWAGGGGPWQGPAVLAPPGTCAPGTPVGLGRRRSAERLEAVYAGADGSVQVLWADADHPWRGPGVLAPPGTCVPGTAVTLASRDPADRLDALFTAADGSVRAIRADGGGPWTRAATVTPAGGCAPGSPVALAYEKSAHRLDAVVAGADGAVLALSAAGEEGWLGPVAAAPPGTCAPGAAIGLGHRTAPGPLDAVFAGDDGSVRVVWALPGGGWHEPVEIAPPGSAARGSGVALTHGGPAPGG